VKTAGGYFKRQESSPESLIQAIRTFQSFQKKKLKKMKNFDFQQHELLV
jgi:hypothetical protein